MSEQETIPAVETSEAAVNQSSEVRNPDKLLELYNAQKAELKELKTFRTQQETLAQQAEAKRLEEKGQYEAALTLKVQEALTPVNQLFEAEKKRSEKLATENAKIKAEYEALEKGYKGEKLKSLVNQSFAASDGDTEVFDLFWSGYGGQFSLSDDGKPVLSGSNDDINTFMKTLSATPVGARLFKANLPEGSGTTPQSTNSKGSTPKAAPRVVTQAEALNPRKAGFTLEDVMKGDVVIQG